MNFERGQRLVVSRDAPNYQGREVIFGQYCQPDSTISLCYLSEFVHTPTEIPVKFLIRLPEVYWIISEGNADDNNGEFGVEVDGIPFFYYKHQNPIPAHRDLKYRQINKREFGEVILRPEEG